MGKYGILRLYFLVLKPFFQISSGSCQVRSYASLNICASFLDRDLSDRESKTEIALFRLLTPPSWKMIPNISHQSLRAGAEPQDFSVFNMRLVFACWMVMVGEIFYCVYCQTPAEMFTFLAMFFSPNASYMQMERSWVSWKPP